MDLNEMAEELKMQQNKPIYNVEDFEERLSELTIGTDDVQQLMDFVRLLEKRFQWQSRRCDVAANMLGHDMITEAMMDE
jgi:hypothetical protein